MFFFFKGCFIVEFFHKLIYKPDTFEARIATTVEHLSRLEALPEDIKNRVIKKFSDIRTEGQISVYSTKFELADRLIEKIKKYRLNKVQPRRPVIMNLCEGIPEPVLSGLAVGAPSGGSGKLYLTINLSPEALKSVPLRVFINAVSYLAESSVFRINEAQIRGLYLKGSVEPIQDVLLIPGKLSQKLKEISQNANFIHIYEKSLDEYILCLLNLRAFKDKESKIKLVNYLKENLPAEEHRKLQEEEILDRIETALCGPEYFGYQLPVTILSTLGREESINVVDDLSKGCSKKAEVQPDQGSTENSQLTEDRVESGSTYPGQGLLSLKVSPDRCSGSVSGFNMSFYRDPALSLDEHWFEKEISRLKIHTVPREQLKRILENLRRQKDISGIQIATGVQPEKARNPVIVPTGASGIDSEAEDTKASKLPLLAKAGDKIAGLEYLVKAKNGIDIFGQVIISPPPDPGGFLVGPGVRHHKDGYFYAQRDGRVICEKDSIEVCESLEIKGDVNAAYGSVEFDGPIFIEGNVESGAKIRTSGDLSVTGNIGNSHIHVKGNADIQGGIITGPKGYIRVRGQLSAEYIENSVVICRGDLTIHRSVMMSTIYVEGKMVLTESGARLNSSRVFVYQGLETPNLGNIHGAETIIWPGSYWRQVRILENNRQRYQNLTKKSDETKILLNDFKKQNKPPFTPKKQEQKEVLIQRIRRLEKILGRLVTYSQTVEEVRCPNLKSYVLVKETLSPNCQIILADGRKVRSPAELMGVAIDAKADEGKEIVDLGSFKVPECTSKPLNLFGTL